MKENRRHRLTAAVFAAIFMLLAAGCGGSSSQTQTEGAAAEEAVAMDAGSGGTIYENASGALEEREGAEAEGDAAKDGEAASETARKLIKTVDLTVETDEFDALLTNVEERTKELGGYIERSDVYNGSQASGYRSRSASLKVRVPSDRLDEFVEEVAERTNVTNRSEYVEDVTLQYVDLESHKKALYAEQESLLSMLEQAESIEDILAINAQLTDVRYQIESMESQLRTYDNQIDYSTVYLNVDEIEQYAPAEQTGAGDRIRTGFVKNLRRVGNGISNFFIELIIAIPLLVTAAVALGICIGIVFLAIRAGEKSAAARKSRAEKKRATDREKEQQGNGKTNG
ncbi:MAG TPA: DUF4349 domain-containing protein [Candidatus Eisenbergiella merdigallinarum]|uniref:DUF4349 domain-containing protein n=1 Tax=Candidatus Eisenbergiella merdigallinarum TaxID=2838552 RepID=A0A9D2MQQ9_9FIRM|nr:DUF4349 domain-containing protein [Candidatus Eisenbergiella merdigallinarum]